MTVTRSSDIAAIKNAIVYKGAIDCSSSPNFPAGDAGHMYSVSVAGKIGGASGAVVSAGDEIVCKTDGSASGDYATVGANWDILQTNIDLSSVAITGGTIKGVTVSASSAEALVVGQNTAQKATFTTVTAQSGLYAATSIGNLAAYGGSINATPIGGTTPSTVIYSFATGGTIVLTSSANIVLTTSNGTAIGTNSDQLLAFYGATPVNRPDAMSTGLTVLTVVGAATADFNIQALTAGSPNYGFVTSDEGESVLDCIKNLQTRVDEIESRLEELGLIKAN